MGREKMHEGGSTIQRPSDRNTARRCVRKVKGSNDLHDRRVQSEPRQCRKRKPPKYEDDTSYSESELEEEVKPKQKKISGFRCSAHLVPELMGKLTPRQLSWVTKIGFGPLQEMVDSRCPKSLTMWLVDKVDTENGTLDVCGKSIDIKRAVKRILQLPSGH